MASNHHLQRTPQYQETNQVPGAEDETTIDLYEVWELIKKHIWMLISATVVGAVVAGGLTWALIPKTYAASGTLFLTPRVQEGEIDINSLNSNQKLVSNVMNLLTQDNIMSLVAQETGLASTEDVRDSLTISNTDNTEIITVTATTEDPRLSKEIATTTINTFIDTMKDSLNVQNIQITDQPKLSYEPVGPSIKKNAAIGGLAGLVLGLGFLVIHMLTDKRLKTREEAEKYLGLPVYAELPDLEKK
ncbi:YveK family protein [Faecalibaculum rodentium]|uniref:YveK family protein n=1 Tax=Faecalibaculum rodentium TaxID=1702221 RepID=UPI001F596243|nr:Wzz/FepE/Etk N-terminal domain-containing protein [Faecalibaculum rodentium]